jgi:subtilisin-like proprotein convertase family protein
MILPVVAAVWLLWPHHQRSTVLPASAPASPVAAKKAVAQPAAVVSFSASTAPRALALLSLHAATNTAAALRSTNKFAWRLTNTTKSLRELSHDSRAILLANALIDTRNQLNLGLPKNLQAKGDPGAYIVQANGVITPGFRATLALAGAQIISYIPNNAYLVQASAGQASTMAGSGLTVLPYEPYYKVSSGLIAQAATEQPLPPTTLLNVGAFASDASAVQAEIQNLGGIIVAQDTSPFGPVFRVSPPADWTALAQLPGVQVVEPTYRRMPANDLSRVDLGISEDTLTNANYLDLYGSNVVVEVNDSGIQYLNAQFSLGGGPIDAGTGTRVSGDSSGSLQDTSGHGTFVAGIIAGNGANSLMPTNVGVYASGSISNADFRGKAPLASLFSVGAFGGIDTPYNIAAGTYNPDIFDTSDYYLQTAPALTNALISNNSWTYGGDTAYDLASASYDAAVRDALPTVTGSQPVLFIFAAGDAGGGNDDGSGAVADTIESPATAKNVITVGALQQARDITNIVTEADGSSNEYWLPETESSTLVADYSSRGNVGIGVEGDSGRFKPDLVAPGNFIVSTKSSEWDQAAYYDPTNYVSYGYPAQDVSLGQYNEYPIGVPYNAVGMIIQVSPNAQSPQPFPTNIPISVSATLSFPFPVNGSNDFSGADTVSSPPDGGATYIDNLQESSLTISVGGSTNFSSNYELSYDLTVTFVETNDMGNYFQVLSNLNASLGPDYRYESGTSMSAPAVSGMAALIQDFFTNTLHMNPSPALLKGMLINGARAVGSYQFEVTNAPNDQGWGLPNLPNSLPSAWAGPLRSSPPSAPGFPAAATNAFFFQDQSPTNALATGDSQTFQLSLSPDAQAQPLRVTLTWTDPPGDPAAGIKLVNNLDIVVTNVDTAGTTNVTVYYGNDFSSAGNPNYSVPETTNDVVVDMVNNVRNIFLQPTLGTNYSVTVVARSVNVNAVTAQTNSVVQDFALVISSGDGFSGVTNAFTLTENLPVRNPTADEDITLVTSTNTPLLNQLAGENSPLLGTNTVGVGTNSLIGTNGQVTIGMTNQWHFYVVTNYTGYTNAAFITFFPLEMAVSRMGTLSDTVADATRPQGDIDLYVAKEPGLLTLDPIVISNCVNGVGGDAVSAGPNGTEYVAYSNSVENQVYYIGVKSEDHLGTTYGFLPVFTAYPFSSMNSDGSESINGLTLPVSIVPGTPKNPSLALVFALALYPLTVNQLIVTNQIWHQNFGDLYGQLSHDNINDILNNHDAYGNTFGSNALIYFDSPINPISTPIGPVTVPTPHTSDGPGSLVSYQGQPAVGPWILTEADNAYVQTGSIVAFGLRAYPHEPANKGLDVYITGGGAYSGYIDVPAGVTNMTFNVTNETLPTTEPPLEVFLKYGAPVSPSNYDQTVTVSNGVAPYVGGSIEVGPSTIPPINPGVYYYEIYNPSVNPATNVFIIATFSYAAVPSSETFQATTQTSLPDDAVATNTIVITNTQTIFSTAVGVVIDHPRVSDLTLTLISPLNQRYTLVENRGGATANMGHLDITTNFFGTASAGGAAGNTNVIGPVPNEGTLIVDYNMYTVPDKMDIYYDGVDIYSLPYTSGVGQVIVPYGPGTDTNITIVMDQGGDPDASSLWTYTPQVVSENYNYLTLTDDTNLAPELIKFAIPPFNLDDEGTNYVLNNFEGSTNEDYFGPTNIFDAYGGWTVPAAVTNVTVNFTNSALLVTNITVYTNNLVSVVTDPATAYEGSNYLALGLGTITRNIVTIPTRQYTISYSYRGPGIAGWWRGEGNALDSANPETNGNNGELIGRFTFPEGEVGQAFGMVDQGSLYQFAGTNNYVQIPQAPGLDVGTGSGLTVEGWINPTNLYTQEPLVEWLSRMPTNAAVTNVVIVAGPFLYRGTDHYYYLLGQTNWATSEMWATNMGGHLVTIDNANEQNWVYDTFGNYGGTNRNLWIGLNDVATAGNYVWSSGETPGYYDWVTGQPDNSCNGNERYTLMLGATNTDSSLWVLADQYGGYCTNNGYTLTATNDTYGVVELDTIPTNGVQFWVSVTNSPATGNSILSSNGCLYANLVDTTNGFHEIWSAPGLVQSNVYQHVALTYNTNSGVATLYYNGTNVCSTNLGVFTPKTTGDVLLGKDMSLLTNNYYSGAMDEMSIYGRCLSDAEIAGIYEISERSTNNPGTNGQVVANGKFDPAYPPAIGLAVADVTLAGRTSVIVGDNTNWQRVNYTFVATSNLAPFQITGIAPGILLDDFTVTESALGNLYYQPEQPLDGLVGESAAGTWTLEILDNRAGDTNALAKLVSWQLQFVLATNSSIPITLYPEMPGTNTVPPGDIAYFYVPIPGWSHWATNILVSSSANVEFLFNPTNPPTGSGPGDLVLLNNSTGGAIGAEPGSILQTTNPPVFPLTETNYYYLGVKNISTVPATVVVRVDFDITSLTNDVPVQGTLTTNEAVQYYSFDVSTNNPQEATFQLLKLSGNAYLVASYGTPLPTETNFAYGSFNGSNADQDIYIQTNSQPVPLTPGRWYLGVYRNDPGPVTYSVLAKELDAGETNVITLTNNVPFRFTTGPGAALTNFFLFNVTNAAQNIHFELYDMTGNGDLTVQTNGLPLMPPFYDSSQEPGLIPEYVYLRTNNVLTNLAGLWYLGVPNHETNEISFTILAVNDSLLITNTTPAFPGAVGAATYVAGGRGSTNVYHVTNLSDNGPGSLRYGLNAFTNSANIVFDVSGNIPLLSPLVISNSNLTIAGQTAPGAGITLQNYPTLLDGATNVIIRYLRFRPGDTGTNTTAANFNLSPGDSLAFTNTLNVMIDHVSASWSTNAVLSVLSSSNVTVQWSVIADSFSGTNINGTTTNVLQGQGSILRYGAGSLSFNHNLYADNNSSSPLLGDNLVLDFVNNVIYNWGILPGWSITNDSVANPSGSTNEMNYVCNYVLAGLHSQTNYIAFWSGSTNTWVFQTNNFIDAYTNQTEVTNSTDTNAVYTDYILNGSDTGWSMFTTNTTEFGDPFPLRYPGITNATIPTATAEEAYQAYEKVLDFAGDQESRDSVDLTLMRHVRTQSGTFILSQSQVGGWPSLSSQPTLLDTDQDGIPDYWEITFGMNPTNAADGAIVNTNTGYTALETYLNWLAAPHALTVGTNPVSVSLYQLAGGTGRLTFYVTNALNGSVVLTNNMVTNYFYTNGIYTNAVVTFTNSLAIFTPSNNYTSSFTNPASFDFYVTNNDTTAWFGPVTVSVVVSATNILLATPVITLTNGVPFAVTNDPVYNFRTTDSPGAVVFQVYNLSGPATLVLQTNGVPVAPDYLATSGTARTNGVEILMVTNSALTGYGANVLGGLNQNWYLGVNNGGTNTLSYTVVATEIPVSPNIITLTNNVPFTWTAGPGPDLTNFFRYDVTNAADVVQFQLFNQSGNGDLTAQTNALPFAPEYYAISQQPGDAPELIQVPAGSGSPWFLGVPNNDPIEITYTIEAQESASLSPVLTNSAPVTNSVGSGVTQFYLVEVPEFATVVSNILASATGPLNLWYSTNTPPTIGQPDDVLLLQNVTSGTNVFGTNGIPQLVPGGYYYLGVQNNSGSAVTYTLETEFGVAIPAPMAPTVVTVAATNTTAFGSTLQATVIPNGATSTVYFAYGFTTNFGNFSTAEVVSNGLYSKDPIAIGVGNLLAATTYYFEAIATNGFGTNYGGVLTFTTPAAGPTVVTTPANDITSSGAELQAGVSPNGLVTTVYFEYGPSTSYGQFTGTQMITSSLNTTNQDIGSPVSGLLPGAIYHYQAIAYNSAGTNYGGDLTFTNLALLPTVTTVNAVNITATSATLQASVNPNGSPTAVYFEYGTTTSYGTLSTTNVLSGNLNTAQSVALNATGLLPGVVYHFQAVGVNGAGTAYGGDLTFTVPTSGPTVITLPATNLTVANVTLPALVTPNGAAVQVYFVYGTTKSYGSQTAVSVLNNNLNTAQLVTSSVSQLSPAVVYHYQAIAFNSAGTNHGADLTFTNPAQPVFLSIVSTNNGYLLSWYAPTNYQFKVQWTSILGTNQWSTFTNTVMYTGPVTPTNGLFTFFDNGSQSGGLGANHFYQLELVVFNGGPTVPSVTTLPATNVTIGSVTLPALVTPNGATATVYFNWGVTTNYGSQTAAIPLANNLYSSQPVTNILTGLLPGVVYHYQAVATNVAGASHGVDLIFTNPIQSTFATLIIATNHGFLVEWYAPTNYQFHVQWATNLLASTWFTFTNIVVYTGPVTPTNGLFTFFDDGSQTGGFGPAGFYRLIPLAGTGSLPPVPPASGRVYQINPLTTLVVTNTATDLNPNAILSYVVSGSLTGTNLPVVATNNGVVTVIWTPTLAQAGMTNLITTVVTDSSATPISAANSFEVIVYPLPVFTSVVVSPTEGVILQWASVPQNQFQIGWTTNLLSPWTYVPANAPYLTSISTNFVYQDTNAVTGMRFYRLREVP